MESAIYYAFLCACVQILRGCASEKQVWSMTTRYSLRFYKSLCRLSWESWEDMYVSIIIHNTVCLLWLSMNSSRAEIKSVLPWALSPVTERSDSQHILAELNLARALSLGKKLSKKLFTSYGLWFYLPFLFKKNLSWPPVCSHPSFPPPFLYDKVEKKLGTGRRNPSISCLENHMDRGAWQATVHGVTRVRHDLATKIPPGAMRRD